MQEIFVQLFEFFGLFKFYSDDFSEFLKGMDQSCEYAGTPMYVIFGYLLVISIIVFFFLHYRLINSPTFNTRGSWWVMAIILTVLNFTVAGLWTYRKIERGEFCPDLKSLSVTDCVGFGLTVATWTFLIYTILTSISFVRRIAGHNMHKTTFWKP